jgi:hypothetical protein
MRLVLDRRYLRVIFGSICTITGHLHHVHELQLNLDNHRKKTVGLHVLRYTAAEAVRNFLNWHLHVVYDREVISQPV